MTGENTPRRHMQNTSQVKYRLDADAAALAFRDRVTLATYSATLQPEMLVKALGPNLQSNGAGSERDEKSEDVQPILPQWDPKGTKQPGQVLKLHFTYQELIQNPEGPHFGWVDPRPEYTPEESARNIQSALRWKAAHPDPLIVSVSKEAPSEKSAYGAIHTKALGRTLREINPRATIDLAAAIARGVIVDPDGKMRCPPGTPNANQFTDEFMTNCMVPSSGRIARAARNVFARYNQLAAEGYRMELAKTVNKRFAKAQKENVASAEEIAETTADRMSRVGDAVGKYAPGISSKHNADYVTTLGEFLKDGSGPEFRNLFSGGAVNPDGSPFTWDDNKTVAENLAKHDAAIQHTYLDLLINQEYAAFSAKEAKAGRVPPTFDEFKSQMSPESASRYKDASRQLADRHQAATRGFMESLIDLHETEPDKFQHLGEIKAFTPGSDPEGFAAWIETDGYFVGAGQGLDGRSAGSINFNPYSLVLQQYLDPKLLEQQGFIRFNANPAAAGALDAPNAQAASDLVGRILDAAAFAQKVQLGSQISSGLAGDPDDPSSYIRLRASHIAYHEFGHLIQNVQARKKIQEMVDRDGKFTLYKMDQKTGMPKVVSELSGDTNTWTNDQWADAMGAALGGYLGPDDGFPPVNAGVLEESMTHLLSGKYYQNIINSKTGPLAAGPGTDERLRKVKSSVFEAQTEIYALKKMGILRGPDIDKVTGWMDEDLSDAPTSQRNRYIPQTRGKDASYFSPRTDPSFIAEVRETAKAQKAADQGRAVAVAQDANVPTPLRPGEARTPAGLIIPRPGEKIRQRNPLAPKEGSFESTWQGLSKLITSDPDTGITDFSPSSRISERIDAVAKWADSLFDLKPEQGAGQRIGDMDDVTLDARYESLEKITSALSEKDALSADEQGQLWAAVEEMSNIVTENNIRRRRTGPERRRAEARNVPTKPGKYVSKASPSEGDDALNSSMQEARGDAEFEEVVLDVLKGIKKSIGDHFKSSDGDKDRGAPNYKPDASKARDALEASRAETRDRLKKAADSQVATIGDDGVSDVLAGGGMPVSERIPDSVTRPDGDIISGLREFANAADGGDSRPTPSSVGSSLSSEIEDVVLPGLERLDSTILDNDIEVVIPLDASSEIGSARGDISKHGMTTVPLADSDKGREMLPRSAGGSADQPNAARVVLRKGDRAALTRGEDGEVTGVTIPPGSIVVSDIDSNGGATAVIHRQQTSIEAAESMLGRLESDDIDDDLRDQVQGLKDTLNRHISKKRAESSSSEPRSERGVDPVASVNRTAHAKTVAIRSELEESGSQPFNPPDREARVSSASGNVSRLSSFGRELADGTREPQSDAELDLRDRISAMGDVDIETEVDKALASFFDSISDQPRIAITRDELQNLTNPSLNETISPSGTLTDGSDNPFTLARQSVDVRHGFSSEAPDHLRPMEVSVVHRGDTDRAQQYIDSLPDSSVRRDIANLSESSEFSLHGGTSDSSPIEVVLSPSAAERTVISAGGLDGAGTPTPLARSTPEQIRAAILPFEEAGITDTDALSAMLDIIDEARSGGDISKYIPGTGDGGRIKGMMIGGVSRDDIDSIRIPLDSVDDNDFPLNDGDFGFPSREDGISALVEKGLSRQDAESVLDYAASPGAELESARLTRLSRAARQRKAEFGDLSDKVIFTNKDGIDVTKRDSFAGVSYAEPNDDIDRLLAKKAHLELIEASPQLAKDLKSGKKATKPYRARNVASGGEIDTDEYGEVARQAESMALEQGMRSRAGRLTTGASVMGRIARSERAKKLLRRAGMEDDDIETVQFLGELGSAFAIGGPPAMAAVFARAAGRSGFDVGIRKAVERGLISQDAAQKLIRAADRVAPDGLPGSFEQIISDSARRVDTDALGDRARGIADAAREALDEAGLGDRLDDVTGRLRDRVGRVRRAVGRNRTQEFDDSDFLDDPYGPSVNTSILPSTPYASDSFDLDDPYPTSTSPMAPIDDEFGFMGDDLSSDLDIQTPSTADSRPDKKRRRIFGRRGNDEDTSDQVTDVSAFEFDIDDPFQPVNTTSSSSSRSDQFNFDDEFGDPYESLTGSGMRSRSSQASSRMRDGDASFSRGTGMRSRSSTANRDDTDLFSEIPGISLETDDDAALFGQSEKLLDDASQAASRNIYSILGDPNNGYVNPDELGSLFSVSSFGDGAVYPKNVSDIRKVIDSLPDDDPNKELLLNEVEANIAIGEMLSVARALSGRNDPFGGAEEVSTEEANNRIRSLTSSISPRVMERINQSLSSGKKIEDERNRQRERRKIRLEAETDVIKDVSRINSVRPESKRVREFPESGTDRVIQPKVDWKTVEPKEGITRPLAELETVVADTIAPGSDLTEEGRVDDLAKLILSDDIVSALDYIESEASNPQVSGMGGQELVAALVKARGFDAPAARLSHDEIDRLVHLGSYIPISRGGSSVPQESHISNDTLYIGRGVDGAGLYFAIEDAGSSAGNIKINHQASHYAREMNTGENPTAGRVVRAVVSPEAKVIDVKEITNMVQEYRNVVSGESDPGSIRNNPLVQLRQRLLESGSDRDKEIAKKLDTALTLSSGADSNNATTAAAVIMGYDAVSSTTADNRYIVLNRSAFPVASTSLDPEEWSEMSSYERLVERSTPKAKADGITLAVGDEHWGAALDKRTDEILSQRADLGQSAGTLGMRSRAGSGNVTAPRYFSDDYPYMDAIGLDPRPRSDEDGGQLVNSRILGGASPDEMKEFEQIARRAVEASNKRREEIRQEIIEIIGSEEDFDALNDFEKPTPDSWKRLSDDDKNLIRDRMSEMQRVESESHAAAVEQIANLTETKRKERKAKIEQAKKSSPKARLSKTDSREYKGVEIPPVEDIQPDDGEYPDDVVDAARKLREQMEIGEPKLTESLIDVADKYGGSMEGLEFRFKATKGLAKKISNYMAEGLTLEEATEKVKDAVRYTMSLDEDQYVMGLYAAIGRLQSQGHNILEIKNYWEDGDAYQGINMVVMHPDGFKYELQFHTPTSFRVKQDSHDLYDKYQKETDRARRFQIFQQMVEAAKDIKTPSGDILSIGDKRFQPFEEPAQKMTSRNRMRTASLQNNWVPAFGNNKSPRRRVGQG